MALMATGLALVFLLSPASESIALELIAAPIRAQMLDFFDDHGSELLSVCCRSNIKSLPKIYFLHLFKILPTAPSASS
jgi:hypothetical protein